MEKVIYALWREAGTAADDFNERLRGDVARALGEHAHWVRVNVQDAHVEDATSSRFAATHPQMDAFVQLWVDTAFHEALQPIEQILRSFTPRFSGWLVCESTQIANHRHPPVPGQRTEGFSQMVCLGKPERLTWEAWRHQWQTFHTRVGIDTQDNFEYVQNLVIRPVTYAAPPYAAFVEECFPYEAQFDDAVFYGAVGDPEKLARHQQLMADSCSHFIDFDKIDCIPTSQYQTKAFRS